jgi:hypothetical protein
MGVKLLGMFLQAGTSDNTAFTKLADAGNMTLRMPRTLSEMLSHVYFGICG